MRHSKWYWADLVVGTIGTICGLIGIVTGLKSGAEQEAEMDARLEQKYGLTPVQTEEE